MPPQVKPVWNLAPTSGSTTTKDPFKPKVAGPSRNVLPSQECPSGGIESDGRATGTGVCIIGRSGGTFACLNLNPVQPVGSTSVSRPILRNHRTDLQHYFNNILQYSSLRCGKWMQAPRNFGRPCYTLKIYAEPLVAPVQIDQEPSKMDAEVLQCCPVLPCHSTQCI